MTNSSRREDLLVSLCMSEIDVTPDTLCALEEAAVVLQQRFRYWEILLLTDTRPPDDLLVLVRRWKNIRLLQVRRGMEHYRRRLVAVSEAIGDVVVVSHTDELPRFDLLDLVETAHAEQAIVIGQRDTISLWEPLARFLGRAVGFHITSRDTQTISYPRSSLGRLLAHPDSLLAVRFPPTETGLSILQRAAKGPLPRVRTAVANHRRIALLQRLTTHSAPLVLSSVSWLSVLLVFVSGAYACYAIVIWLVLDSVQPGWLTTSLLASFSSAFLSVTLFGVVSGVQRVLELLTPNPVDDVLFEVNGTDLFGQVRQDLNLAYNLSDEATRANTDSPSGRTT